MYKQNNQHKKRLSYLHVGKVIEAWRKILFKGSKVYTQKLPIQILKFGCDN